ncbi:MAG: hypothetical protein JWP80_1489 [Pseudomonas sp.]|nr:hypothetical protein [Pseudomonas sp.]
MVCIDGIDGGAKRPDAQRTVGAAEGCDKAGTAFKRSTAAIGTVECDPGVIAAFGSSYKVYAFQTQRACHSRSHVRPSDVLPRGRYSQPIQPL